MRTITMSMFMLFLATQLSAAEISISAAASLKEVVTEISANYTRKHPETSFARNFAASGALAKQIAQGAPADIYVSANMEWMDFLKGHAMLDNASICALSGNRLVFIGPSTSRISGMQDLTALKRIAIGSPKSVPAGQYAVEAMGRAGIEQQMRGRLVLSRDVREALLYVERSEVDGAFVYRTDALLAGGRIKILFTVPETLHAPVTYPVALTSSGAKRPEARRFLAYLKSEEARNVLKRYGFTVR